MSIRKIYERLRSRKHRREYREVVKRWYADGGDDRFRFDYALSPDSLVLDFGGYQGQWASDLYARRRCRIIVFEPVMAFADAIGSRFAHNPDIRVERLALGRSTRGDRIHICGASSSAFRQKAASEAIEVVDVAEWFERERVERVALMKVNIEGGEYELLERMLDTGLISRVENLQVQFHKVADDSDERMMRIQKTLAETHKPDYQYRYVWENWSRRDA